MKIEIVEPSEADMPAGEHNGLVRVWCDCSISSPCPAGKRGWKEKCSIWLDPSMLSSVGQIVTKKMNTFDR